MAKKSGTKLKAVQKFRDIDASEELAKLIAGAPKTLKNKGFEIVDTKKYGQIVEIINPGQDQNAGILSNYLYRSIENICGYSMARRYMNKFPIALIASYLDQIKDHGEELGYSYEGEPFTTFFASIDESIKEINRSVYERVATGKILFSDVPHFLKKDAEVIVGRGKDAWGGIVKSVALTSSFFGTYYTVTILHISDASGVVSIIERTAAIFPFRDKTNVNELEVRLITQEEKDELTTRGKVFRNLVGNASYASYTGHVTQFASWGSDRHYRSDGRVMVDIAALRANASDLYTQIARRIGNGNDDEDAAKIVKIDLEDSDLWRTSENLFGFSFASKQWGRMFVSGLSEIKWRSDAFDSLVMDHDKKMLIKALVENHSGSFEDIVEGKGGGCIFLLHGAPGNGKTLTAETVAEVLKRPLYMISVGELGTNPDALEERLREILDLAITWDAVLLLDEADIFLEARDERDIVRNAMVGVFLRLLEYHQGILFLTTNRVKNIDHAFMSRISIALKYNDTDNGKRIRIWMNLLAAAGVDLNYSDVTALSNFEINGRQIKNTIRLGQTLARSEGKPVTVAHFLKTLAIGEEFVRDMQDSSYEWNAQSDNGFAREVA